MVRGGDRGNELLLPGQAEKLATPDCNTASYSNGKMGPNIREQATNWPTPASRDCKGENSEQHATLTGGGRKHMDQLPNFVAYSHQAQAIQGGQASSPDGPISPRLRLNPNFVDWLMGWPPGWSSPDPTDCGAVAMESFHSNLDWHLSRLLGEQG